MDVSKLSGRDISAINACFAPCNFLVMQAFLTPARKKCITDKLEFTIDDLNRTLTKIKNMKETFDKDPFKDPLEED